MRGRYLSLFTFAAAIAALIVLLKVLNWVPSVFEQGLMHRYGSIEEVRSRLQLREIYVPSYFPQRFSWPPSSILAQTRPYDAIVMEFRDREKGDIALSISQSASESFMPDKKIAMVRTQEKVAYPLKGRDALLDVGTCKNEEPCCKISWKEGRYRITVVMKSVPSDLIRIADSMVH